MNATASPRTSQPCPEMRPVDIIIPVYKGFDQTRRCIESVLETVHEPHGVFVIDDSSPEAEIVAWLKGMASRHPRIRLLHNPQNLGFVGTVNRGMNMASDRDVILLNSDTEVSGNWVERMQRAAYSDRAVATVTPFSNNATICSWPRFCHDNTLPPGVDRQTMDDAFAIANSGHVVDIPTGVGFAMYIRRDALDALGCFNEEAFGKGYGEENDFCRRAAAAGWRNLLLTDTFVYHAGSVSFGIDADRLNSATKNLLKLHPTYLREVRRHIRSDPARVMRWRAALSLLRHGPLPVLLFIVHRRGGGTHVHLEQLADHLKGRAWSLVLAQGDLHNLDLTLPRELGGDVLPFELQRGWDGLVELLSYVGVDRVHLHHLLDMPDRVLNLPAILGVPFDFTAHDFYAGCPRICLSGPEERRYCGQPDTDGCYACLMSPPRARATDITSWRAERTRLLLKAERVFAPSRDATRRLSAMLPEVTIRTIPHPDAAELARAPAPRPIVVGDNERLRVLVLGALSRIKGADLLEATAREAARRGLPVEFHLLGYAARTLDHAGGRLTVHGRYQRSELPDHLARISPHIAWLPARSPETYSYTLSEVIAAELPVVVSDLGAPPERIVGRPLSWVLPWDIDPADAAEFLARLRTGEAGDHKARAETGEALPTDFYSDGYLAEAGLAHGRPPRDSLQPPRSLVQALEMAEGRLRQRQALRGFIALRRRLWGYMVVIVSHPMLRHLVRRVPRSTRERLEKLIKG